MRTHVGRHLTYSLKQPVVIQDRLANLNTVTPQLACIPHQSRCMGQRSNGHGAVISSHAAKLITCNQCGLCSQVSGAKRSYNTGRPRSNHNYIEHGFSALAPMHEGVLGQCD